MKRTTLQAWISWALIATSWAAVGAADSLLLTGGQLVDPRAGTIRSGHLLVVDGVIAEAPEQIPEDFDGQIVDVAGKWIVPGLRDFHTHSALNMAPGGARELFGTEGGARRMLYAGVTGFLDLFNHEDYVLSLRDQQREQGGAELGADIFAAGPCLTATGGHGTEYPIPTRTIDSPEDARREIAELVKRRPDVIKIIYEHMRPDLAKISWRKLRPSIDQPTLEAAVRAATDAGIPTVIHIHSWQDVRHSVLAGATAVTHLPHEGPPPEGLIELMAERGTVVIPTMSIGDLGLGTQPTTLDSELLQAVAGDAVLAAYRAFDPSVEKVQFMVQGLSDAHVIRSENLRKLAEAGVPIVAGTDAGNPWTVQGYSLHRELELMVQAGLSPWQVLASASVAAGELVGRSYGLDPGDEGTFVVLDASPIEDIRNTRKIHRVVHHGEVVDRAGLLSVPDPTMADLAARMNLQMPGGPPVAFHGHEQHGHGQHGHGPDEHGHRQSHVEAAESR